MDDDEDYRDILEKSRFEIVQRLQLDRSSLFDYLRSKGVLDASDCEIILVEKTREQKASKFLDVLQSKGKEGFLYFLDVLQLLNSGLYECVTGKKANPSRIWENMRNKFALGNYNQVPDVELLSGQLKRTIDDLQDLALRNQQLLKENQNLGLKLDRASTDLDLKHRRVEVLEKQMNESERGVKEVHNNANRLSECVTQQLRSLQQGLIERNTYIIALQMKLLATEEEIKESKRTQDELKTQNDSLSAKWQELSRDYDYERRESMKLSAKLKSQKGDIAKADEFEKKCQEFKEINEKMKAERDESLTELEDLKDWTEALKARYDLLVEEYLQLQHNFVSGVAESCKLREEIEELKLQLSLTRMGVNEMKSCNADLEETVKQYREQRDYFSEVRKTALMEKDELRKNFDETVAQLNEMITQRDTMIEKQTEHAQHSEEKYDKACIELKTLRQRIADAERELEELKLQRIKANSCHATQTVDNTKPDNFETVQPEDQEASDQQENVDRFEQYIEGFPWKSRRGAKEIMQSLRKRVSGYHNKAMSLDRSLDIMRESTYETLSQEARTSLSLQGHNLLFKTPPTYTLLRAMFGMSVGGRIGSLADLPSVVQGEGVMLEEDTCTSDTTDSTSPDDDEVKTRPKLHRTYTKSHSAPSLKVSYRRATRVANLEVEGASRGDPEEDEADFHWVRRDECRDDMKHINGRRAKDVKSKDEVDEFFKSLVRPAFRQRACAIKKKKEKRSSSDPVIKYPVNHENDVTEQEDEITAEK